MTDEKNKSLDEKKGLNTWVEIVHTRDLKNEVKKEAKLEGFDGLIVKKIHKSDLTVSYEKMEGGLASFLNRKIASCKNLPKFVETARKELC